LDCDSEPALLLLNSKQGEHSVLLGEAKVFSGHATQEWFPGAGLCAPAPHARQRPPARSNPGMQTQSAASVPTPFGLVVSTFAKTAELAGHARHSSELVEPTAAR
jgi:hypothetical protein